MKKTHITSIAINANYKTAVRNTLKNFPTQIKKIKNVDKVFIKININQYLLDINTNLNLLQSILEYIRDINPICQILILENNIKGNFTRLLVNMTGIKKLIKNYKTKFIYLDEKRSSLVTIGTQNNRLKIYFPNLLIDKLISERESNFYLNLAQLKTHNITKAAGGMFNQLGLIATPSQGLLYCQHIHKAIVDILAYLSPDLTIVDANNVLAHGDMPPASTINENIVHFNQLFGGTDPVAVDCAAFELLGYNSTEVLHLEYAMDRKLGEGNINNITINGERRTSKYKIPYTQLLSQLPNKMDVILGANTRADDVFLNIALQFIQIMYKDFAGYGTFSIICGSEFKKEQLENLRQPIIILGANAYKETGPYIYKNYFDVFFIDHCSKIDQLIAVLIKVLGIGKYQFFGVNPFTLWRLLFIGRIMGLNYRFPRIRRDTKRWKNKQK